MAVKLLFESATIFCRSAWSGFVSIEHEPMKENDHIGIRCIRTTEEQVAAVNNAIYMIKMAFSNLASFFSEKEALMVQSVLYLTPIIFNIVNCRFSRKKITDFPKMGFDPIKSVCLLAVTISSVALIVLGQALLGGAILTWILIRFIQQGYKMPEKVNDIINGLGFVGVNVARLTFGNILHKCLAIYEFSSFTYQQIEIFFPFLKELSKNSFFNKFCENFDFFKNEVNSLSKKIFLPNLQILK